MKIDTLKERARKHEQNEEWGQALSLYLEAIAAIEEGEEPDITLYNRAADIQVRLKDLNGAVDHYEQAIDLYLEADLPNNAYAVCRKILRTVPERPTTYLRMGQIRIRQGFVIDARQHYLAYAEMMESQGTTEEAIRALGEFVGLVPDDVETRIFLGEQLMGREQREEGLRHLLDAWRVLTGSGQEEEAGALRARIEELDPAARFPRDVADMGAEAADGEAGAEEALQPPEDFAPTAFDAGSFDLSSAESTVPAEPGEAPEVAEDAPSPEWPREHEPGERDRAEAEPGEEAGLVEAEFEEISLDEAAEASDEAPDDTTPLPLLGDEPADDRDDALRQELAALRGEIAEEPDRVEPRERMVQLAYRLDDRDLLVSAYVGLAEAFRRSGLEEKADSVFQQVLQLDPRNERALEALGRTAPPEEPAAPPAADAPADPEADSGAEGGRPAATDSSEAGEGFVDLGSMILDDAGPQTTRWVVEGHDPSGDEDADFARMLSEFKSKVADNLAVDDARAQYDLGTAYKEMGLLDEAISMFQKSLRTRGNHLASLEMLGQCFLERGEPEVAVRVLRRALEGGWEVEEDLLGIYYYLGHAFERSGKPEEARDSYEKVFALDINFKDVTDRLRSLR
jgi:tetratricopeptide (TPR) repeat protein